MQIGEIWRVRLPLSSGHEQQGMRPAVVVQNAIHGNRSPLVLVVPVTTQAAVARFPAVVALQPSPGNGLAEPSFAMVFQARALDRSRFVERLGLLSDEDFDAVLLELRLLTSR